MILYETGESKETHCTKLLHFETTLLQSPELLFSCLVRFSHTYIKEVSVLGTCVSQLRLGQS